MDEGFPKEMIVEVLLWVSIPDVSRFRCVCKAWRTLIDDPRFKKTHFDHSMDRCELCFIGNSCDHLSRLSVSDLLLQQQRQQPSHHHPIKNIDLHFDNSRVLVEQLLGTCNGLLCFRSSTSELFLLNPTTGEMKKLPELRWCCYFHSVNVSDSVIWGFGFNSESQEYEVVRIMPSKSSCNRCLDEHRVVVHKVGSDSWRSISQVPPRIFKGPLVQTFVNGALHWQGIRGGAGAGADFSLRIISFSIADEMFGELPYPESYYGDCRIDVLGVMGGHLCVLHSSSSHHHRRVEIWVMEEYGIKDSWNRKITITDSIVADSVVNSQPLRFLRNGLILALCAGEKIVLYDPNSDTVRDLTVPGIEKWFEALICEETLSHIEHPFGIG